MDQHLTRQKMKSNWCRQSDDDKMDIFDSVFWCKILYQRRTIELTFILFFLGKRHLLNAIFSDINISLLKSYFKICYIINTSAQKSTHSWSKVKGYQRSVGILLFNNRLKSGNSHEKIAIDCALFRFFRNRIILTVCKNHILSKSDLL